MPTTHYCSLDEFFFFFFFLIEGKNNEEKMKRMFTSENQKTEKLNDVWY